ncbi:MAG: sigma-70 family RNA polymerase sigma factor [Bacteroidia bacterium]|nr:sigma-70 family RNA polymerase sigma factor [Bacteroidia bacterium]
MTLSEQEFLNLIKENAGLLYKFIHLYVDDEEDKKDLYQEMLVQLWHSLPTFKGDSKISTWMYKVCLNTALTFRKKNVKIQFTPLDSTLPLSDQSVSDADTVERLYRAIKTLSEIDRTIITLHLDGYQNEEIAELCGISKNHVAVKLHRIKQALTLKLNPNV